MMCTCYIFKQSHGTVSEVIGPFFENSNSSLELNTIVPVWLVQQDSRFNQDIDRKTGYHTRSILCMPIQDHYGEVLC